MDLAQRFADNVNWAMANWVIPKMVNWGLMSAKEAKIKTSELAVDTTKRHMQAAANSGDPNALQESLKMQQQLVNLTIETAKLRAS